VQETLVRVLATHPLFQGLTHPVGYCKTVLMRLSMGFLRPRFPRTLPENEVFSRFGGSAVFRWDDHVIDSVVLSEALTRLPRRQRACVYLRYVEGLDDKDIADVLRCRRSTVRSQVARGLEKMGLALTGAEGENPR
jgi:DNA-directed RNA polymerase specialized sigma24 family protein